MLDEGTLTFNSEPDVKKVCGVDIHLQILSFIDHCRA